MKTFLRAGMKSGMSPPACPLGLGVKPTCRRARFVAKFGMNSRLAISLWLVCALVSAASNSLAQVSNAPVAPANLAAVATASASQVSGDTSLGALNDGLTPRNSRDNRRGSYGNWPNTGTQWVEYDWSQPISTKQIEMYWWDDRQGVRLPKACRVKFWDGKNFASTIPQDGTNSLGVAGDKFNVTTFPEITTTKLRLEMDGSENFSTGVLEWRVLDSGKSPDFPPRVQAGVDRDVMLGGKTYL
ncbi:MAG: hypothetical protein RL616_2087, partial [Verrucomicrobiota bacterium]